MDLILVEDNIVTPIPSRVVARGEAACEAPSCEGMFRYLCQDVWLSLGVTQSEHVQVGGVAHV